MPDPRVRPSPGELPPAAIVEAELDRILASEIFVRSDRLSAFLTFIVHRALAGHGDALKEQVIAVELYGKDADFSTAADPIVRVDARRLRDRLREYYASARPDGLVISVPKGSYTPMFLATAAPTSGSAASLPSEAVQPADDLAHHVAPAVPVPAGTRPLVSRRGRIAAALLVLIVAASGFVVHRLIDGGSEPMRLLTVTSLPGSEEDPALSPDGNFVAFSWTGATPDDAEDIWIKAVDGDAVRQLTNTPGTIEKYPVWSPDGRYIAFTRIQGGRGSVFMVSALGGPERLIADRGSDATWLPDGRSLVMGLRTPSGRFTLVHHVLDTGARRQLTEAPQGFVYTHPRVSPDGTTLAFSQAGEGRAALFVMPVAGGEPTRLGDWTSGLIGGLTWTPDGREILFGRPEMSGRQIVRVTVNDSGPARSVSIVPHGAVGPAVSGLRAGGSYRLAVASGQPDVGLRMVDLGAPRQGRTITAESPFCDATRMDVPGPFSVDGTQVAFVSDRSGSQQVWVAARDGSALHSVTRLQDATVNLGSWSPDGRWLVFDATIAGNTDLYLAPVDGGPVKRLTDGKSAEIDPEWSRDGRWIYYSSNESGPSTIWRMPADGGARQQLTSEVGYEPRESVDGQSLYFIDKGSQYGMGTIATLRMIPLAGGPGRVVYNGVTPGAWNVTELGIVFVAVRPYGVDRSREPDVVEVLDLAENRVRPLGEMAFRISPFGSDRFLTVSRDGRWALASHIDRWDRDILVVDNFR